MSRLLVVRTPDHLVRACADVAALMALQRGAAPAAPQLLGIWVEHQADAGTGEGLTAAFVLSSGSCPVVRESSELAGVWALCHVEPLARLALLDTLVERLDPSSGPGARFMPVFPDDAPGWREEWLQLAAAHPGRVVLPMRQTTAGALPLDDLWWAETPSASEA
jgi:hypothetical protein